MNLKEKRTKGLVRNGAKLTGEQRDSGMSQSEREHALRVILSDPHVAIGTNRLERALRTIPMGRTNWLFCRTEVGAERVGIIQSLLTTCRLHDINPYTHLSARVSFQSARAPPRHLIKYNRKTATLVDDDGRQWPVTPGLLSPVKDVAAGATQTTPRADRGHLRCSGARNHAQE